MDQSRSPAASFVVDRDSIMHGSAHERDVMRPYDEVQLSKNASALLSRDPDGSNHVVMAKRPSVSSRSTPESLVRALTEGVRDGSRPLTFTLSVEPDEQLQELTAREYNATRPDIKLEPEHVLAASRTSFFKPEQRVTRKAHKHFGPFDVYTIEHDGGDLAIAVPHNVRLSDLETAMDRVGTLEAYFDPARFGGLDAMLKGDLEPVTRENRKTGERYTTQQIRNLTDASLEHREKQRVVTTPLRYSTGRIEPVRYKTS